MPSFLVTISLVAQSAGFAVAGSYHPQAQYWLAERKADDNFGFGGPGGEVMISRIFKEGEGAYGTGLSLGVEDLSNHANDGDAKEQALTQAIAFNGLFGAGPIMLRGQLEASRLKLKLVSEDRGETLFRHALGVGAGAAAGYGTVGTAGMTVLANWRYRRHYRGTVEAGGEGQESVRDVHGQSFYLSLGYAYYVAP